MNYYKQYMDRQALSPEFLEQLEHCSRRPRGRWRRWGALAACCLLLAGLGLHMSRPAQTTPVELPQTAEPAPEKGRLWTEPPPPYVQDNTEKRVVEDTEPAGHAPCPCPGNDPLPGNETVCAAARRERKAQNGPAPWCGRF